MSRAVVVGGVDYGEADRVVHVLTETGKQAWFAHNARKSKKRFSGSLEPFVTVTATFEPKRRQGMAVIASLAIERSRIGIQNALDRIALAGYAAELISRVSPEGDEAKALLELLERVLDRLQNNGATNVDRRALELVLLDPLGYRPDTEACVVCGTPAADLARWSLVEGGVVCDEHGQGAPLIGPKTRAWAGGIVAQGFDAIDDSLGGLDAADARTAAAKLGKSLDTFYRALVDGPLRSTAFLEEVI